MSSRLLKALGLRILIRAGVYPHIYFTYSPFKILEFDALTSAMELRGEERVLDIGCGNGLQTLLLGRLSRQVVGVDINQQAIAEARRVAQLLAPKVRAEFLASTVASAELPPTSFDCVFSICVMEHIPDYSEVIAEAYRLLKPGGRIAMTVDALETITDADTRDSHRIQHHVAVYFTRSSLAAALADAGFGDVQVRPLFRSNLARGYFLRGIAEGFNFGRLRAPFLAARLRKAEARTASDSPGLFLLATARKPRTPA